METYKELYFQLKSYYFHSEDFENFSKPVKIQTLNLNSIPMITFLFFWWYQQSNLPPLDEQCSYFPTSYNQTKQNKTLETNKYNCIEKKLKTKTPADIIYFKMLDIKIIQC
jgi:hypothetical protein